MTPQASTAEPAAAVRLQLNPGHCPFCPLQDRPVVHRVRYRDVHLRQPGIEDFEGVVRSCDDCGLYLVEPRYEEAQFPLLYSNLSRKGRGSSVVKHLAAMPLAFSMTCRSSPNRAARALARMVGAVLDPVLLIPLPSHGLRRGARVLDVGCGDGFHLKCLGAAGAELFGTEIHPAYAPFLENSPYPIRYWIREFTQIDWQRETGFETFDLIVLLSVFYRLNAPWASLDLAWRLLRPGGTIVRIEPFCPNEDSARFINRFNFPQGFSYVHDPERYVAKLVDRYPGLSARWKVFYGRSHKLVTGRELTPATAVYDIASRMAKTMMRIDPWLLKLELTKASRPLP